MFGTFLSANQERSCWVIRTQPIRNGPFDLDLVFAPDGIESFDDAWRRHVEVKDFPVCHPDDIIRSKEKANRIKDRESLPRLKAFRDYWKKIK